MNKRGKIKIQQLGQSNLSARFNAEMAQAGNDNTSHLKGKLSNLTETARQLTENLNIHKKEV